MKSPQLEMGAQNRCAPMRPSVTISSYTTLKRLERLERQAASQTGEPQSCSELSTDFFKVRLTSNANNQSYIEPLQQQQLRASMPTTRTSRVLLDLSQICGPTGSVRGHKNVVRRSLEGLRQASSRRLASSGASADCRPRLSSFVPASSNNQQQALSLANSTAALQSLSMQSYCDEYLERLFEEEQGLCVAYTTTLGVIRRTFEDSKKLKSILNLNLIRFKERDVYLNQEYKFQLKMRLHSINVPALFVDGQHIGGLTELETMNENGELQKMLAKFKMSKAASEVCACCGNARFIACPTCNGSRKSTIHHFKFNSIALRCIRCDENEGLVACPTCNSPNRELQMGEAPNVMGKQRPGAAAVEERDENNNEEEEEAEGAVKSELHKKLNSPNSQRCNTSKC